MLGVALIGASGLVPNLASLWLLTSGLGANYLISAVLANQIALAWNLVLVEILFHRRRHRSTLGRASRFYLLGNLDLVLRVPALAFVVTIVHMGYLAGSLVTLVASFLFRFAILDRVIYAARPQPTDDLVALAT
jgi:dolichol-phosphate mannosyltransferase